MEGHYYLHFVSLGVGDQTALPNSCIPKSVPVQEEISWDSFAKGQSKSVNLQLKEKLYLLDKEVTKHMDGHWVKTCLPTQPKCGHAYSKDCALCLISLTL